jgi:hypothetical protein
MDLGPRFDQATLTRWQLPAQALHRIDREDGRVVLIVRVEVCPVVLAASFNEHANHDAKEARQFIGVSTERCSSPSSASPASWRSR